MNHHYTAFILSADLFFFPFIFRRLYVHFSIRLWMSNMLIMPMNFKQGSQNIHTYCIYALACRLNIFLQLSAGYFINVCRLDEALPLRSCHSVAHIRIFFLQQNVANYDRDFDSLSCVENCCKMFFGKMVFCKP